MPIRTSHSSARGMHTQRDRGRRKKDHRPGRSKRGAHETGDDQFAIFESWLANEFTNGSETQNKPSQSFGFKEFLQNTANFALAPDEKLRILAIHWEDACVRMDQPKGWNILKRIYRDALKYDPTWGTHYHSMSISARACAFWCGDTEQGEIIFKEARSICREGLAVAPEDALLHLSLGRCEYSLHDTKQALVHFEDALELEPKLMWARLYQAHCLHDLERWPDAVTAYEAVDLSFFKGNTQWRADLMRDQLSECYLQSGSREKALAGFLAVLKRYESNAGMLELPQYLTRAAKGELCDELATRTIALLKKEQWFDLAQSIAASQSSD